MFKAIKLSMLVVALAVAFMVVAASDLPRSLLSGSQVEAVSLAAAPDTSGMVILKEDNQLLKFCTFVGDPSGISLGVGVPDPFGSDNPCDLLADSPSRLDPVNLIFIGFTPTEVIEVLGAFPSSSCPLPSSPQSAFGGFGPAFDLHEVAPSGQAFWGSCESQYHIRLFDFGGPSGRNWLIAGAHHEDANLPGWDLTAPRLHSPDLAWEAVEKETAVRFDQAGYIVERDAVNLSNCGGDPCGWRGLRNNGLATVIYNQRPITLEPTGVSGCTDTTSFVAQATYPQVSPGQHYPLFFTLKNTGTCTWSQPDYYLANVNGQSLGAPESASLATGAIPPGEEHEWLLDMVAPQALGTYRTQWSLMHNGTRFGPNLFIDVTVVGASDSQPTAGTGPAPSSCVSGSTWRVGQRVKLRANPQIRSAPSFSAAPYSLPETPDGWEVDIIDGPRCNEGGEWWDISRVDIDGGGTGWVNRPDVELQASQAPSAPPKPPVGGPYGPCDERDSGVFVFSDEYYRGDCVRISENVSNLDAVTIEGQDINDWINSIRLVGVSYVRVCEEAGGGGKCLELTADRDRLAPDGMEHKISSVYFSTGRPAGTTDVACPDSNLRVEYFTEKSFLSLGALECQPYSGQGEFVPGGSWVWGNGDGPSQLGHQSGNYSIRWSGTFYYQAGKYACFTDSDDGSAIYFDDQLVVNNLGDHSRQRRDGTVALNAGYHKLRIDFDQGGGDAAISGSCSWSGPLPATATPVAATPTPATVTSVGSTSEATPTVPGPTEIPVTPTTTSDVSTSVPPSRTSTAVPPTAMGTNTPTAPSATLTPTWTSIPPTATSTNTPRPTPTFTATPIPPTPTRTPIPFSGNIAHLARISGGSGCGPVLTDGSLSATCHAGSFIQFDWTNSANIHRVVLFNEGGINWFEMRMSDGSFRKVDFGGPNTCVQVDFPATSIMSLRIDFIDGIPSTMKEIEIWATNGPQSSGHSCSTVRSM